MSGIVETLQKFSGPEIEAWLAAPGRLSMDDIYDLQHAGRAKVDDISLPLDVRVAWGHVWYVAERALHGVASDRCLVARVVLIELAGASTADPLRDIDRLLVEEAGYLPFPASNLPSLLPAPGTAKDRSEFPSFRRQRIGALATLVDRYPKAFATPAGREIMAWINVHRQILALPEGV